MKFTVTIETQPGASSDVRGTVDDDPMCMQITVPVSVAGLDERQPVAVLVVDARQAEVRRQLGERDRPHAPRRVASDLVGRELRVPQRHDAQRDEAAAALPGPLVDHEVVVGLHARERELLVVHPEEHLAGEAHDVREAERPLDARLVHGDEALLHLVAGRRASPRRSSPCGRPAPGPCPRRSRAGGWRGTCRPPSARSRWARRRRRGGGCRARSSGPNSHGSRTTRGPQLAELRGEAGLEEVGRLDHVVVHGDDPGQSHRGSRRARDCRSEVVRQAYRLSWPAAPGPIRRRRPTPGRGLRPR